MKILISVLLILHVIFCLFIWSFFMALSQGAMVGNDAILAFVFILLWPIVLPLLQTDFGQKIMRKIVDTFGTKWRMDE